MPAMLTMGDYEFPYDEEIFQMYYDDEPDLVANAFLTSGAMVEDARIAKLISQGSAGYSIPFYNNLNQDAEDNYNGKDNITLSSMGASHQDGVVFGRAHGWTADDFAEDFTAANPLAALAARTAKHRHNAKQARLISITDSVLSLSSMSSHVVKDTNGINPNILADFTQEVWGMHRGNVKLAIMPSTLTNKFEKIERVDYLVHTDPNGVKREINVYEVNGLFVVEQDDLPTEYTATAAGVYTITVGGTPASGDKLTVNGVTVTLDATSAASVSAAATALKTAIDDDAAFAAIYSTSRSNGVITCTEKEGHYGYGAPKASKVGDATITVATGTAPANRQLLHPIYFFAAGAIRTATAPVKRPFFVGRDELTRGGYSYFGHRYRETIHPNGFSYTIPKDAPSDDFGTVSPTDAQLFDAANWALAYSNEKAIPFGKLLVPSKVAA